MSIFNTGFLQKLSNRYWSIDSSSNFPAGITDLITVKGVGTDFTFHAHFNPSFQPATIDLRLNHLDPKDGSTVAVQIITDIPTSSRISVDIDADSPYFKLQIDTDAETDFYRASIVERSSNNTIKDYLNTIKGYFLELVTKTYAINTGNEFPAGVNNLGTFNTNTTNLRLNIHQSSPETPFDIILRHLDEGGTTTTRQVVSDVDLSSLRLSVPIEAESTNFVLEIDLPEPQVFSRMMLVEVKSNPLSEGWFNSLITNTSNTNDNVSALAPVVTDYSSEKWDSIIEYLGTDNLKLALRMNESGDTIHDFFDKKIKFKLNGPKIEKRSGGLLDNYLFMGDYALDSHWIEQEPILNNDVNGSFNSTAKKIAVKLPSSGRLNYQWVQMVSAKLKRVGNLPNASIKMELYYGDTSPSAKVHDNWSYMRDDLNVLSVPCDEIPTDSEWIGFSLDTPYRLNADSNYWLVLEYEDDTGVDASNYIAWEHDASGSSRATYDGSTWTAAAGESCAFKLYDTRLRFNDEITIVMLRKLDSQNSSVKYFSVNAMGKNRLEYGIYKHGLAFFDGTYPNADYGRVYFDEEDEWVVDIMTWNKWRSQEKCKHYINGKLMTSFLYANTVSRKAVKTNDGKAGIGIDRQSTPWVFGAGNSPSSTPFENQVHSSVFGGLGPILMLDRELSQEEISKLANLITSKRI